MELFNTGAERRSFAFFESRACHDLGGSFHWQFWAREVLQAAVHYPSTRHLVIAIGAAYEGFQRRADAGLATDECDAASRLAIEQSNQAIRLMSSVFNEARTESQSAETTCNILTASILFAYLACLQGQVNQAIEHVRSGLRVLQSFEKSRRTYHSTNAFPVSIRHLKSLLTSIYGQIRCMINDEALTVWEHDPLVSVIAPVISFSSIADAHSYVENLWHDLLAFLQNSELQPPNAPEELTAFRTHHFLLGQALESSREALELLASGHSPDHDGYEESGLTILRIYHIVIAIRLRINPLEPGNRESAFDSLEPELAQMLQYCEQLVEQRHTQPSLASFSSGLGYVMPLHMIAARCRNPRIRRRALQLLQNSARREGLWDGVLTGKFVTTTVDREERLASMYAAQEAVPSDTRVREVKVEFLSERKAKLRYITVADWKANLQGDEYVLEW
jgi:hypothetical protein